MPPPPYSPTSLYATAPVEYLREKAAMANMEIAPLSKRRSWCHGHPTKMQHWLCFETTPLVESGYVCAQHQVASMEDMSTCYASGLLTYIVSSESSFTGHICCLVRSQHLSVCHMAWRTISNICNALPRVWALGICPRMLCDPCYSSTYASLDVSSHSAVIRFPFFQLL